MSLTTVTVIVPRQRSQPCWKSGGMMDPLPQLLLVGSSRHWLRFSFFGLPNLMRSQVQAPLTFD